MHSSTTLSFADVNMEARAHLSRVEAWLLKLQPDLLCVQEVCEPDLPLLKQLVGPYYAFTPMEISPKWGGPQGIALFSRYPLENVQSTWYAGYEGKPKTSSEGSRYENFQSRRFELLSGTVVTPFGTFSVATTHFPVTENAETTQYQLDALENLERILDDHSELVLCGDFNAPRGREVFDTLAARYHDAIPAHYKSSLDPELHRAGSLPYMVDGLFLSDGYEARDVSLMSGVSDHCAVTATISKSMG